MKKITYVLLLLSLGCFAQKEPARLLNDGTHLLYVAFQTDIELDRSTDYTAQVKLLDPRLADIINQYQVVFEQGIAIPEDKLQFMERQIIKKSGNPEAIQTLRNTLIAKISQPGNAAILELARAFETLSVVKYCELMATQPIEPPNDIPPATSDMEASQTYIGPDPGVNMQYVWDMGLTGSGIRVRDVEYGFNKNHEEFNDNPNAILAPDMTISSQASQAYTEHGTAVFGVVYADKGSYGVSGMAHGAQEMVLFPEWQQSGYNRTVAVTQAIANSVAGDVIIYEMQAPGPTQQYVPAEYSLTIWNLTKAATDSGIIVVAAAGNGEEDLDSAAYTAYRDRGDSGAIIVGGGTANTAHNKISYSTYGSRVDLQAWATNVRSSGYGDFLQVGDDFNQGYTLFSGTSSATPIVASCAIVLQSYFHGLTGDYLESVALRNLLIDTGIAQGSGGHIGPIPNMQAAIAAVNALALDATASTSDFLIFPNPVTDKINVISDRLTQQAAVTLFNSVGQMVFQGALSSDKTIDVSRFPKGIYFLRIVDNQSISTKKIIKD